jgi:uncharacterized membrane protein (TIGR02234 family)
VPQQGGGGARSDRHGGDLAAGDVTRDRRRTVLLVLTALAGAGCCAAAAALTWWSAQFTDPLVGAVTTTATGSQVLPELVPVALFTLAGLGATFATRGWARRVVGALVLVGGLLVAARSVIAMSQAPDRLHTVLTRPARAVGDPELHPAGPILAVIGGLLIAIAGALIVAGAGRARGMSARYDAPSRAAARAAKASGSAEDPGALWQALDAGADPTAGDPGPAEARNEPGTNPTGPVTDTHPGRIP